MNRIDFMRRLELLLSDLPENERREAVQYYNDYFNDAGVENEEEVLESLGTPEEVAQCAFSYTGQYLAEKLHE